MLQASPPSAGPVRALPVLAVLFATACGAPPGALPARSTAAADHHLHIRTRAGAEHLDRLEALEGRERSEGEASRALTAADALAALDAAGIERGLVLSNAYMFGMPDLEVADEYARVRAENDYVADQVALHPGRLVGVCSVNPLREYALPEIERCGADRRIGGLKLHLTNSDVDLRNPSHVERLAAVFDLLGRLQLPAVVHLRTRRQDYGADDARIFIDRILSRAPELLVQVAHAAGWGGYDAATDAALGAFADAFEDGRLARERITFDLGAVVFQPEAAGADTALARQVRDANALLAERIRSVGIDRFVYATDWPGWPPVADASTGIEANVRLVRSALPLTDEEMERLLGNAGAVLGGRGR